MKCFSFFKVGGGFRAEDYAKIRQLTEGKWMDWDRNRPPNEYVELAGGDLQRERPDMWIKPCDSVVVEVKAASVGPSESFKTNYTLRFPRFKRLREDKDWKSALSLSEFALLKSKVEAESSQRDFVVQAKRKMTKRIKKEVVIAGTDSKIKTPYAGSQTKVFQGLDFHVMTDMLQPFKKSKAELEEIIKANGGSIYASPTAKEHIICLAEKKPVKVASIIKRGETNIVRPAWLFDAIKQSEIDGPHRSRFLIPFEPVHMFHLIETSREDIESNVDMYGDSYCRDITPKELGALCEDMVHPKNSEFDARMFRLQLEERGRAMEEGPGNMFARYMIRFVPPHNAGEGTDIDILLAKSRVSFAGGKVAESDGVDGITHFVVVDKEGISGLRAKLAERGGHMPRIVRLKWVQGSWAEMTVLDEERYVV
jgi:DNA ligase-4